MGKRDPMKIKRLRGVTGRAHKAVPVLILVAFLTLACVCPLSSIPGLLFTPTSTAAVPGLTASAPFAVTAPPPSSTSEAPFNIPWDDRSLFEKDLASSSRDILKGLPGASVYHLSLSLSDPPVSLAGLEEVRYTNTENTALTEVDFAVFPEILGGSIDISSLQLDRASLQPVTSAGIMRVQLPAPLPQGKSITFHIEFQVTIPQLGGDYYYGIFGYNDTILSLAHSYPTILVYDENGWNNKTPDLDGDPLFSDTSLYLVSISAPSSLVLAASGVEVQRSERDGRQLVLYADAPARDFYLAASSNFHKKSIQDGEITINSYTLPDQDGYAQSILDTAKAAVDDFSTRYAPFPYVEYDIVPIVTSAGGVEFPGIVAIAQDVYGAGNFQEVVVTHETGHQWFYNLVGNETQLQPWLDESMAEFVTWQYYLDRHGTQGAQEYEDEMKGTWDSLNDEKIPIGEPVSSYSSMGYVAIVYGRGPLFFLALRQQVGQDVFDQLIKDYVHQYSWTIATTDAFKKLAEQHCACDLSPLFNEWVNP
jgi:hypothetical protein